MCYGFDGQAALDTAAQRNGIGRRGLIKGALGTAAAATLAVASTGTAGAATDRADTAVAASGQRGKRRVPPGLISIQLYTIRADLEQNYERPLRYVANAGYRRVEQAGYYGRTAKQLRRFHDRVGVHTTSSHDGLSESRDAMHEKFENANTLGQEYVVVPFLDSDDPEQWKQYAYQMNSEAAAARREGLRYGYHNHAHEFLPLSDGQRPWDIFMAELDPVLVHLEVDLYWIATGAVDSGDGVDDIEGYIIDHINAAPMKVRQYHVKDRDPVTGDFRDPGKGHLDFPRLFDNHRVEEYIVENDDPDVTPRQTAEVGYDYLRTVRF
jgi:sugar phosphate isomerase/epimerase